jgi:hypothetical protein
VLKYSGSSLKWQWFQCKVELRHSSGVQDVFEGENDSRMRRLHGLRGSAISAATANIIPHYIASTSSKPATSSAGWATSTEADVKGRNDASAWVATSTHDVQVGMFVSFAWHVCILFCSLADELHRQSIAVLLYRDMLLPRACESSNIIKRPALTLLYNGFPSACVFAISSE